MYSFLKDETVKKLINALPNPGLRVSKDTEICALQRQSGFEENKINGKSWLNELPSIWLGVPSAKWWDPQSTSPPPDPQYKFFQLHAALRKNNCQSFLVVTK